MIFVGVGEVVQEGYGTATVWMCMPEQSVRLLKVSVPDLSVSATDADQLLPAGTSPEILANCAWLKYRPAIVDIF
jgi:hypothetical protein